MGTQLAERGIDELTLGRLTAAWLERDDFARLLLDEKLNVRWANHAAKRCLADEADVEIRSGVLVAADRRVQAELVRLVAHDVSGSSSAAFPSKQRQGHLVLWCTAIGSEGGQRIFGVQFRRSGNPLSASYADLASVFKLTKGEHRVLLRMIEGLTADKIAAQESLSVETIRTHIRNIYAKIGVNSREELFAHLAPYRL